MVQIIIQGVEIDFPFQPYACQVAYMEKVITCLQQGKNGVLESPTGTGKTLCLLCATLGWRSMYAASMQLEQNLTFEESSEFGEELREELSAASGTSKSWTNSVPKIIYASRTHTQLTQAVDELKATVYKPRVSVLGSRDQLCIHPEIKYHDSNTAKIHMCKTKVNAKACGYYKNLEAQRNNPQFSEGILDIEDMVALGSTNRVCPYYMSRELKGHADIVFMPYNYLLDKKTRTRQGIDLSNTIVLIDEAHNVENVCEQNSSFDLTSLDVASFIDDCDRCIKVLQEIEAGESDVEADIHSEEVAIMKAFFLKLEETINGIALENGKLTKPGSYIYELLQNLNVTMYTAAQVTSVIDRCNALLAKQGSAFGKKTFSLQKFADVLKLLFGQYDNENPEVVDCKSTSGFFKVHINATKKPEGRKEKQWFPKAVPKEERTLSYWCFNPGLTMTDLMRLGVRSLILTSGTLSPMDTFKAELSVPFDVELENPHVIDKSQIFVGVLPRGPDGVELCSSFETRSNIEYQTSLGNSICNLSSIVPHGMLVFFPSYPVMDQCIRRWQDDGNWQGISQTKVPFVESRGKSSFSESIDAFYKTIKNPDKMGAAFFAVCRGKVSEGLDFANNNGRAVIITGLPYPPYFDDRVTMKMQYLDENLSRLRLAGKTWYKQQASCAVNQAIGRVIRHRNDFGAILFLDKRFSYESSVQQLPKWLRKEVKRFEQFFDLQREATAFFRRMQQSEILLEMRSNPSGATENDLAGLIDEPVKSCHDSVTPRVLHAGKRKAFSPPSQSFKRTTYNREASHSLAVLKAGLASSKDTGPMLNKLMTYEHSEPSSSSTSSAVVASRKDEADKSQATRLCQKKKNFRIIMPKAKEVSKAEEIKQRVQGHTYVDQARTTLDAESFRQFSVTLLEYKTDRSKPTLVAKVMEIFQFKMEFYNIFEGLGAFFKNSKEKAWFEEECKLYKEKALNRRVSSLTEDSGELSEKPKEKFTKLNPSNVDHKERTLTKQTAAIVVNETKRCSSCHGRPSSSYQAPCGHICCCFCWEKALKDGMHCMICSKPFDKEELVYVSGQLKMD